MTLNLSTKMTAIVQWAASVTSLTIIRAHQSVPRPGLPFGAVQILAVRSPGTASGIQQTSNKDKRTYHQWSIVSIQFSFFGAGAMQSCQKLVEAVEKVSGRTILDSGTISPGVVSQITDLPQLRENGWEETATVDIQFHVAAEYEETVGYIESVTTSASI